MMRLFEIDHFALCRFFFSQLWGHRHNNESEPGENSVFVDYEYFALGLVVEIEMPGCQQRGIYIPARRKLGLITICSFFSNSSVLRSRAGLDLFCIFGNTRRFFL